MGEGPQQQGVECWVDGPKGSVEKPRASGLLPGVLLGLDKLGFLQKLSDADGHACREIPG